MDVVNLISNLTLWGVVKVFVLVGMGVYVAFAAVVVRQVRLMMDSVQVGLEGALSAFAWLHLLASLGLFALMAVVL